MTAPGPARLHPPSRQPEGDGGREQLLEYNGRPTDVVEALRGVADWLDTADKFVDEAFRIRGKVRPNAGDEVQRDMRHLAEWFAARPEESASAARYMREATR